MKDVYFYMGLASAIAGVAALNLIVRVADDVEHHIVEPAGWEEWPVGFENPYFTDCAHHSTPPFEVCMEEHKAEWLAAKAEASASVN